MILHRTLHQALLKGCNNGFCCIMELLFTIEAKRAFSAPMRGKYIENKEVKVEALEKYSLGCGLSCMKQRPGKKFLQPFSFTYSNFLSLF